MQSRFLNLDSSMRLEATAADALNFAIQRFVIRVVAQQSVVIASFSCGKVARGRLTVPNGRLRDVMRGLNSFFLSGWRVALSQSDSAAEQRNISGCREKLLHVRASYPTFLGDA